MASVMLPKGCVLVKKESDIFAGTASINDALNLAKEKFNQEGTADDLLVSHQ